MPCALLPNRTDAPGTSGDDPLASARKDRQKGITYQPHVDHTYPPEFLASKNTRVDDRAYFPDCAKHDY